MNDIATKFKEERLNRGLSQSDLSDKIILSLGTVNAIENGKRNLTLDTINKIAKFLSIPIKQVRNELKGDLRENNK